MTNSSPRTNNKENKRGALKKQASLNSIEIHRTEMLKAKVQAIQLLHISILQKFEILTQTRTVMDEDGSCRKVHFASPTTKDFICSFDFDAIC